MAFDVEIVMSGLILAVLENGTGDAGTREELPEDCGCIEVLCPKEGKKGLHSTWISFPANAPTIRGASSGYASALTKTRLVIAPNGDKFSRVALDGMAARLSIETVSPAASPGRFRHRCRKIGRKARHGGGDSGHLLNWVPNVGTLGATAIHGKARPEGRFDTPVLAKARLGIDGAGEVLAERLMRESSGAPTIWSWKGAGGKDWERPLAERMLVRSYNVKRVLLHLGSEADEATIALEGRPGVPLRICVSNDVDVVPASQVDSDNPGAAFNHFAKQIGKLVRAKDFQTPKPKRAFDTQIETAIPFCSMAIASVGRLQRDE